MSDCPKCGRKLKLTDISQYCPGCGTNLRFFDFDERFFRDAKWSELSMANVSVKLRRLKASFLANKITKMRIVSAFLPLLSLLIPSGNALISLPFSEKTVSLSAIGLYSLFTDGSLNYIMSMKSSPLVGAAFSQLFAALIALIVTAVLAVFTLLFTLLGFLSIQKTPKLICTVSALGICGATAIPVLTGIFASSAAAAPGEYITGSLSFGFAVTILMFAFAFTLNVILIKKGIPVEYDEGMLERLEIYKKVRKGEIKLDDLPQPVVETSETRAIDEEIRKEKERYEEKA